MSFNSEGDVSDMKEEKGCPSDSEYYLGPGYQWKRIAEENVLRSNSTSSSSSSSSSSSVESYDKSMRLDHFVQKKFSEEDFFKFNDDIHGILRGYNFNQLVTFEQRFKRISDVLYYFKWKRLSIKNRMKLFGGAMWQVGTDDAELVYRYLCAMKTFIGDVNNMYLGDVKKHYIGVDMPRLSDPDGRPLELHIDADMQCLDNTVFDDNDTEYKYCKACLTLSHFGILKPVDLWCCNSCLYRFMAGKKEDTLQDKIARLTEYSGKFDKKIKYMKKYGHAVGGLLSQYQNTFEHRTLDIRNFIWSFNRARFETIEKQFKTSEEKKLIDINWRITGFYC